MDWPAGRGAWGGGLRGRGAEIGHGQREGEKARMGVGKVIRGARERDLEGEEGG